MSNVRVLDESSVRIILNNVDKSGDLSLSYLWTETPVTTQLSLPIYADDQYRLPSPPWKIQVLP